MRAKVDRGLSILSRGYLYAADKLASLRRGPLPSTRILVAFAWRAGYLARVYDERRAKNR